MRKLLVVNFSIIFLLVGCGMSEKDKTEISQITCNVIEATRNMDAAQRIKEVNSAREQMGEERFLGTDDEIKESVGFGLCVNLVRNDENYQSLLETKKEEAEIKAAESLLELQRLAEETQRLAAIEKINGPCSGMWEDTKESTEATIEKLGRLPDYCENYTADFVLSLLRQIKYEEIDKSNYMVEVCYDFEDYSVLSIQDLKLSIDWNSQRRNEGAKLCEKEPFDITKEELEFFSEGIKLQCQKNSEGCHEDWIAEG